MDALLLTDEASVALDGARLLPPTSLSVEPGECVALLGSNGAGKTTLLRVLSGRVAPSSGRALLRGRTIDEREARVRTEIATLIDPPTLYPDLTLRENLALIEAAWSGEQLGTESDDTERGSGIVPGLGAEALDAFELLELADRFVHQLSTGQRQSVMLAMTFARPSSVILLDEPEQRLDRSRRSILAGAIVDACEQGIAVVFASHDSELVDAVSARRVTVGE